MYLSIVILPFLGSILSGFLGRKVGVNGSQWISCLSLFFSALLSTIVFYEVGFCSSPVSINVGNWIDSELMVVSWEFMFDQLSVVFCIMITYITFLILVYTVYYMEGNPHNQRFFSYLSAFAGFMLVLVTGANYFVLFVGWEGKNTCLKWFLNLYFSDIIKYSSVLLFVDHKVIIKRSFHIEGKIHSHKRIGPHNLDVLQVVIGSLLGDGHLEKRTRGIGSRLIIEQTNKNVEYLMWLYRFFNDRGYCSHLKPKLFKRIKKNNTIYYGVKFNTYTFSSFNWLHELYYPGPKGESNIKVLPILLLTNYFNPMALAIWFMDDGSQLGSGFKFATNCFNRAELEQLCLLFLNKFHLNCSLHKNKNEWTIYIKKSSAIHFINLVEPFMLNSMKYKLGNYSQHCIS